MSYIIIIIIIIGIQPLAGMGRDQSSVRRWYGSDTLHPGQVLRVS